MHVKIRFWDAFNKAGKQELEGMADYEPEMVDWRYLRILEAIEIDGQSRVCEIHKGHSIAHIRKHFLDLFERPSQNIRLNNDILQS
jgi:hypothetical protein